MRRPPGGAGEARLGPVSQARGWAGRRRKRHGSRCSRKCVSGWWTGPSRALPSSACRARRAHFCEQLRWGAHPSRCWTATKACK